MILDNALAHSRVLENGLKRKLKVLKPWIRRYVFNADASHKQGRFAVDCTDIICREARYAVRPFPNVYIEVDNWAGIRGGHMTPDPDASERLGFLWTESGHCYVLAGNDHKAEFTPFIYAELGASEGDSLHEFYSRTHDKDDERFRPTYEWFKQMLMIGNVADHLKPDVDKFAHNLTDLYEIGCTNGEIPYEILDFYFKENVGVYKSALSCLFLLNDRIKQQLVHVSPHQKIVRGKLKTIHRHDVVTIDLDIPQIRKVYDTHIGTHATPIEHEISEHWVHYDLSTQCTHDWVPFQSEEATERDLKAGHEKPLRREVCKFCGGRRTRKPVAIAGDPSKGSNVGKKQYRVVASKEKEVIKKLKEKPE